MSDDKYGPQVDFDLESQGGNAVGIIMSFGRAAKKAGWSKDQVEAHRKEAMSGDYDNVLQTVMKHSKDY